MPDVRLFRLFLLIAGLGLAAGASAGIYDDILMAAEKNDTERVIDILHRGMDINTSDATGNTLLMIAARNGNAELLDFLLRNRANMMKRNRFGDSALMLASLKGHAAIVQRLVEAGADIAHAGWNALHYAAFSGRDDVLKILLQKRPPLDAKAPNGQTALMLAAAGGYLEAVKLLIDADADMDLEDPSGRTAIMLAKKAGHAAVADFLKAAGAVEEPTPAAKTAPR